MAGTETKRIIELTEASTVQSGDFIAVDSNARGTKKVPTSALATSAALTAETNARTGADEQMSERMDGIEEQTALIQNPTKTLSGALCSFTDGADMPMVACTAEIVPKQSGTGTPSPDNVRPISGWESVSVKQAGKNLLENASDSYSIANATYHTYTVKNLSSYSGKEMTFSIVTSDIKGKRIALYKSGDLIKVGSFGAKSVTATMPTFTDSDTLRLYLQDYTADAVAITGAQLELGSTATDYEPYTGTSKTVNLGRTVYGGTLDVVTGVLTAYPFYPSYNGETLNGRWICDRAVYAEGTTPPTGSQVALISGTGTTYQLTPTEVNTLLGENNVWADSGDVEITYRRDISIVINNLESALNG